jgi:protein O-GlcNAc transferase
MFAFDVMSGDGGIRLIEAVKAADPGPDIEGWFAAALAVEDSDSVAAQELYRRILAADAEYLESYINCGRLLHLAGDRQAAELLYRQGIAACAASATLFFNLGVLLEDEERPAEAIAAYQQALQCDPDHCDSHHNLARLFEASGRVQHAIRHFNHCRRIRK